MPRSRNAYAFLAFPIAILMVFTLIPTVLGLGLSLFQWDGGQTPRFVGLDNFEAMLRDARAWSALRNTLIFVLATVPVTVILGFLLAAAVNAPWFRGRAVTRTALFLPTVVSIVAIGFVWRWMLEKDVGLLPAALAPLLKPLGAEPPQFLTADFWPLISIIGISIWRGVGFCVVMYLAALSNISPSLYEAARVDGASRWAVLRHVTWPQVGPMTIFLMVTGIISALQVFDIVLALMGTKDTKTTNVLNLYVYNEFKQGRLGYAAAIGTVIFILTLLATALYLAGTRWADKQPAKSARTRAASLSASTGGAPA